MLNNQYRYTTMEKVTALRRELALREQLYPKRVAERKMSREKASFEISVIRAMIADYDERLRAERLNR